MTHRVVVIPGDGIGPEVIDAALRVLEATGVPFEWEVHEAGRVAVAQGRPALPDEVLAAIGRTSVAIKGPVSTPIGRTGFRSVNVALRRQLGLFAQVRPCRTLAGTAARFSDVDLVVIRDTTEDLYAGVEFEARSPGAADVIEASRRSGEVTIPEAAGISVKFTSEEASRRVVRFAFEYARRNGRRKVTAVHKASVMRATDGLFLEVAREVASEFTDLEFADELVDNACGRLVQRPEDFDVLVMANFYGDIVSDLAAGLTGGVGVAPGANYGPDVAVFEPGHGTAPAHAGRNDADPVAAILSGAMMLDHLGERSAAERVRAAIAAVVGAGESVTYDLRPDRSVDGAVGTAEMTAAIASRVRI
ncbi:MAG: isocitrate dehydrogenase [Actinomycetota bacterium]|nr:isocitrate dehydrogenase [Actinomycetota bacterium]